MAEVLIGDQVWVTENLKVKNYRNGDPILGPITNRDEWTGLTIGAWCYYNNDPNTEPYLGLLYNGYAVTDTRGLAPSGYRVPTLEDIQKLTVGGNLTIQIAQPIGSSFKSIITKNPLLPYPPYIYGWNYPNRDSINYFGFNGMPGGQRVGDYSFANIVPDDCVYDLPTCDFGFLNEIGFFWTSSPGYLNYPDGLTTFYLEVDKLYVQEYEYPKNYGLSVRLIKNSPVLPQTNNVLQLSKFIINGGNAPGYSQTLPNQWSMEEGRVLSYIDMTGFTSTPLFLIPNTDLFKLTYTSNKIFITDGLYSIKEYNYTTNPFTMKFVSNHQTTYGSQLIDITTTKIPTVIETPGGPPTMCFRYYDIIGDYTADYNTLKTESIVASGTYDGKYYWSLPVTYGNTYAYYDLNYGGWLYGPILGGYPSDYFSTFLNDYPNQDYPLNGTADLFVISSKVGGCKILYGVFYGDKSISGGLNNTLFEIDLTSSSTSYVGLFDLPQTNNYAGGLVRTTDEKLLWVSSGPGNIVQYNLNTNQVEITIPLSSIPIGPLNNQIFENNSQIYITDRELGIWKINRNYPYNKTRLQDLDLTSYTNLNILEDINLSISNNPNSSNVSFLHPSPTLTPTTTPTPTVAPYTNNCYVLINGAYSQVSGDTTVIWGLDTTNNTVTYLSDTNIVASDDIASTNDKVWLYGTNGLIYEYLVTYIPWSFRFNRTITCPAGTNLGPGLCAYDNNTLYGVDNGTNPNEIVKIDITTNNAVVDSIITLPNNRAVTGDMLYTATGKLILTTNTFPITTSSQYYLSQYDVATGTLDVEIRIGQSNSHLRYIYGLYEVYPNSDKVNMINVEGEVYEVMTTYPYTITKIAQLYVPGTTYELQVAGASQWRGCTFNELTPPEPSQTPSNSRPPRVTPSNTGTPRPTRTQTKTPTITPTNTKTPKPTNTPFSTPTQTPQICECYHYILYASGTSISCSYSNCRTGSQVTQQITDGSVNILSARRNSVTITNPENLLYQFGELEKTDDWCITPTPTPSITASITPTNTKTPTTTPSNTPTFTPTPSTFPTQSICFGYWSIPDGKNVIQQFHKTVFPTGVFNGRPYYYLEDLTTNPDTKLYIFWNSVRNLWLSTKEAPLNTVLDTKIISSIPNNPSYNLPINNNTIIWFPYQGSVGQIGRIYESYIGCCDGICPTPTPTPTITKTTTKTQTPTKTPTKTQTPTNTQTKTQTKTPTQTPTNTKTNTPTQTPTKTATKTPTPTKTATKTPTPTNTATKTPTPTKTPI